MSVFDMAWLLIIIFSLAGKFVLTLEASDKNGHKQCSQLRSTATNNQTSSSGTGNSETIDAEQPNNFTENVEVTIEDQPNNIFGFVHESNCTAILGVAFTDPLGNLVAFDQNCTIINEKMCNNSVNKSINSEQEHGHKQSDLISEEVFRSLNKFVNGMWVPLCAIGAIANSLNLIVFLDPKMRSATNFYLASISVIQIIDILVSLGTKLHQQIYGDVIHQETKFYFVSAIYLNNYLRVVLGRLVYCLIMLVAAERMTAILFPMRRARSKIVKSPILCTLILGATIFIGHIHSLLKYTVSETTTESGKVVYGLAKTLSDPVVLKTFSMISRIAFFFVPMIGIFMFNIVLCAALKRHSATSKGLQEGTQIRRETRDRQTTIAILVSSFIFLLLSLPTTTNSVVGTFLSTYNFFTSSRYTFLFMQSLGSLFNLLGTFTDFLTYLTMSARYRKTLIRKCFPCLPVSKQ